MMQHTFDPPRRDERLLAAELDAYMKRAVRESVPESLVGMIEYHLGWRNERLEEVSGLLGKRGRPMLSLLTYLLFGSSYQRMIPVAAALEFIHDLSLIFDDIQDRDATRRGRPAVWTLWGRDEAINAGCALNTLVWVLLADVVNWFPPDIAHAVQRYVPQVMFRMTQGQEQDVAATKSRRLLDVGQYLSMIAGKTAMLFEACSFLGAFCAAASYQDQELCRELGHSIGMAFQIVDDVVGVWGRPERGLDKPSRDIEKGKKTYPMIVAYMESSPAERRVMDAFCHDPSDPVRQEVHAILDRSGAKQKSIDMGMSYFSRALDRLQLVQGNPSAKEEIEAWLRYVSDKQLGML